MDFGDAFILFAFPVLGAYGVTILALGLKTMFRWDPERCESCVSNWKREKGCAIANERGRSPCAGEIQAQPGPSEVEGRYVWRQVRRRR